MVYQVLRKAYFSDPPDKRARLGLDTPSRGLQKTGITAHIGKFDDIILGRLNDRDRKDHGTFLRSGHFHLVYNALVHTI